jgi:hypothetical protein
VTGGQNAARIRDGGGPQNGMPIGAHHRNATRQPAAAMGTITAALAVAPGLGHMSRASYGEKTVNGLTASV